MTNPEIDPTGPVGDDQATPRWQPNRRRFLSLAGMAVGGAVIGLGATGCGTAQTGNSTGNGEAKGRPGVSGDTLFIAGFQWGPPTNFNPVAASPQWPANWDHPQVIYESLLRFNMIDGSLTPGLGKELQAKGKEAFVVPLQDAKWADGSDVTADDVVYTFELAKKTSTFYSNVWTYLDSIEATDPKTVTFKIKSKPYNPNSVKDAIARVLILPKAIWSKIDDSKVIAETNLQPVGSGPYAIDKADQTQVALKRRDDYWGASVFGTPAPKAINHPIFKSNNDGDLKLESGEIDVSQQFTAQIWKMWEDKKAPVGTWLKDKPYYLPGNLPFLIFNIHKKGLDNVKVRQAIAYAIDYPNIAATAMSSYSEPANASLIVPTGFESKFYDKAGVEADGWSFNKEKAVEILEKELNCTKGSDGIYSLPDGTKLGGWELITPTGWTDWNTACEVVAKSAKAVGIGIETKFPQAPTMQKSLQNGDFDLAMYSYTGVTAASPWVRFRDAMDDRGLAPVGKTAFYNYNRFSDPAVPALLDQAAGAASDDEAKSAYQALDKIYRKNIPIVPLMYRPLQFFEFNQTNWTGFPTSDNPYAPPTFQGAGIGWLFKIKKVGT